MNTDTLLDMRPIFDGCSTPEPPLRSLVAAYYGSHFTRDAAAMHTDNYIAAIVGDCSVKNQSEVIRTAEQRAHYIRWIADKLLITPDLLIRQEAAKILNQLTEAA